jgi:hypothetical protein
VLARRRTLDAQIHHFDLCGDRRLGLVDRPSRAVSSNAGKPCGGFTCVQPSHGQQQWRFFAPAWLRLRRQDPKNNFGEDTSFDLMKPENSLVSGRQTPRQAQRMCRALANRRQVLKNRRAAARMYCARIDLRKKFSVRATSNLGERKRAAGLPHCCGSSWASVHRL